MLPTGQVAEMKRYLVPLIGLCVLFSHALVAELWLPSIFGDHMVIQRDMPIPVWGKAEAGATVKVALGDSQQSTTADGEGLWRVELPAQTLGDPLTLTVQSDDESWKASDVLVGEVWVCSGQSNMEWPISRSNYADLEAISANFPEIRLITVPRVGTQIPQDDFKGQWEVCTPRSVSSFSAVGYFFGRRLHQTLGIPIGLINNSWGGSAAEAWTPREVLLAHPQLAGIIKKWDDDMSEFTDEVFAKMNAEHELKVTEWIEKGSEGRRPRAPRDLRIGNHRPANIFNGMVNPILGYAIRGTLWYQGESNANRAKTYQTLFPVMIETLREHWGQGEFPFYWVQLADFRDESPEPQESPWAELREAQTMTLDRLSHVGQAVIIDLGEGRDIHPRNKQDVANRLVLHALAKDYGYDLHAESPRYESMEITKEGRIRIQFSHLSPQGLYAFDTVEVNGFTIAGDDRVFANAKARIVDGTMVEVWSDTVERPVAVRYGWAENPILNLYDRAGLPVTPFRSDNWPGVTD